MIRAISFYTIELTISHLFATYSRDHLARALQDSVP